MTANQRKTTAVLIVIAVTCGGFWLYRMNGQNERLKQGEQLVPQAMQKIESGALRSAESTLAQSEGVSKAMQNEWAAWPSIRERERTLTSHLANLRVAHAKRLALVDSTTMKVAQSLASGKLEDANTSITAALSEGASTDQSLQGLNRMVERLKVQDFKTAGQAATQFVAFLTSEVPTSEATTKALAEITGAVERERAANRATHERIASEVRQLIDSRTYRESASFKPVLKGKAMIWDATKNEVEMAYELLPDNLRASSQEGVVTILSVINRQQIVQGYYSVSRQPAYKEKMIIGVVYWPEKTSAGTVVVWGGNPPHIRPVTYHPGYGSSVNIKNWVESLPKQ